MTERVIGQPELRRQVTEYVICSLGLRRYGSKYVPVIAKPEPERYMPECVVIFLIGFQGCGGWVVECDVHWIRQG